MIYLEVPDGWRRETERSIYKLQLAFPNVNVLQVKEKFGDLRIYYSMENTSEITAEIVERYITALENHISSMCSVCGSRENIQRTDFPKWILPYCEKHFPKEE